VNISQASNMGTDAQAQPKAVSCAMQGAGLQNAFLETLRREETQVFVFLVNGIRLQGYISSYDQHSVLLRNPKMHLIYKHVIASVAPVIRGGEGSS
jgi:host factor-I protein